MSTLTKNASCGPDNPSFFESADYLLLCTHVITVLTVPVSIYAFYCIVYVTPPKMKSVRNHLLNLHFWTMAFDVVFNVFIIPQPFLPTVNVVMLGYGYNIGIPLRFQVYLIQVSVCVIAFAQMGLFENRFSSITTNPLRIKHTWVRITFYTLNYVIAFVTVIPPYLKDLDNDTMRMEFLKIVPCPPDIFFSDRFVTVTDDPPYATMFMAIQFSFIMPQASFFSTSTAYLLVYRSNKTVSEATRKMQITFLVALVLQCLIPLTLLMLPVFYIWFSTWTNYYNQAYNNHIVVMVSIHGLLATICMIVIHRPYRDHFLAVTRIRLLLDRSITSGLSTVQVSSVASS